MYKTLLCLTLVTVLMLTGACKQKQEPLRILTENYPPLSFVKDGVTTGFGSDVVKAIQAELGTDYPIEMLSWDDAYSTAVANANVVIFTMDRTPEREGKFHFIGPLGSSVASFYANRENMAVPVDLEQAKALAGIATTTNWFTEQYLKEQGFMNLVSDADPLNTIRRLADKEADLAVFTDITLPDLCREAGVDFGTFSPVLELLSTDYYIAISKDTDAVIVENWRKAFETIQSNGDLAKLRKKWFEQ